jgi:sortase A
MATALVRCVAVAMILAGLTVGGKVLYGFATVQKQDTDQDKAWQTFVSAAAGEKADAAAASPGANPGDAGGGGGGGSAAGPLYLKLTIPKINTFGVAVDGDWNSLHQSSMVHYHDSPAPGAKGNVLVAFHREPHWIDINKVGAGDAVEIQTADGKTLHYKIDFVKVIKPSDIELLKPTQGNDLTLVTCDPPWQDYDRMVFRAHLEG